MCLYIGESLEQLKAETDICCYKVLFNNPHRGLFKQKGLLTPYQNRKVKIGCGYKSKFTYSMAGKGVEMALHSYASIEGAREDILFFEGFTSYRGNMCISKCYIPKGSLYYQGTYDGQASYASNRIRYVELIKT